MLSNRTSHPSSIKEVKRDRNAVFEVDNVGDQTNKAVIKRVKDFIRDKRGAV